MPPSVVVSRGRWFVRLQLPSTERYADGRPKYIQIKRRCVPETEERARELAAQIRAAFRTIAAGTLPNTATVTEYLDGWLATKCASVERRTADYYRDMFERFVRRTRLGTYQLTELRAVDVQAFYAALMAGGTSADAVRKLNTFLSSAFKQAVAWDALDRNPTEHVLLPRRERREQAVLTREEARRLAQAAFTRPDWLVLAFALETGLRPQEYLALRWSDVDLARGVVHVRRAVATGFRGGGMIIKDTKTRATRRSIAITERLAEALADELARREELIADLSDEAKRPVLLGHMKKRGKNYRKRSVRSTRAAAAARRLKEEDLVFASATGGPIGRININNRELRQALIAAGIKTRCSLKALRHTSASILAEKLNPRELQERMGHADIRTTMQYYVHVYDDAKVKAAAGMASEIY